VQSSEGRSYFGSRRQKWFVKNDHRRRWIGTEIFRFSLFRREFENKREVLLQLKPRNFQWQVYIGEI
jgi:hypothetical protein